MTSSENTTITTPLESKAITNTELSWFKKLIRTRELTLLLLIVGIVAVMSQLSPYFLSMTNFRAVAIGLAPTAIIVVGMTLLLVSGGFDLSVGAVLAVSGTIAGMLMINGYSISMAVIITLFFGGIVGFVNGVIVTKLGVNPLVATLGTLSVVRGAGLVLTEGFSVTGLPKSFSFIGSESWGGIPLVVLVTIVIVVIGDLALRHTRYFRQTYYIGTNESAARLSGIAVHQVRISAYIITSVLAALAGILLASRLMAGTPTAGNGLELQVLAAAVIGGASLSGGEGTIFGAFLGVIFVALINNAMTMLDVSIYWQMVVTGVVLVLAVSLDQLLRRKRS